MATYEESGVNITEGDNCSRIAYEAAKKTFTSRSGQIGQPVILDGGFAGVLDMGDFYLVQGDDGIGTKSLIAEAMNKYDTLGYDLLGTVADDAVCLGAEVISITNTVDTNKVDSSQIKPMMNGLSSACQEHSIIIPGGEIAELSIMLNNTIWNATAVGVVKKEKLITGSTLTAGDTIIGISADNFLSNGFSLVRHILHSQSDDWVNEIYSDQITWGEVTLKPSTIYHSLIMYLHGRFEEEPRVNLKAIVHVTGGGLPGNILRPLRSQKLGCTLSSLPKPYAPMLKLQEIGNVTDEEAYKTWHMGVGMALFTDEPNKCLDLISSQGFSAQVIGKVTGQPSLSITSQGHYMSGEINF
jgi:phosphoribosylformylglycinamidine cyclo-ligase